MVSPDKASMGEQGGRSLAIDCLRAVAILSVMFYHFGPQYAPGLYYGSYGVLLFFVISGYCISISANSSANAWHFYAKRLIRLLPALIVCGAITTAAKQAFPALIDPARMSSWSDYGWTLVSLPLFNNLQLRYNWPDGTYWTLLVEFQFYGVCFAAMVVGLRKHLLRFVCATAVLHTMTTGLTINGSNDFTPFFIAGLAIAEIERGNLRDAIGALACAFCLDLYHLKFGFIQPNIAIGPTRTLFLWVGTIVVWTAVNWKITPKQQQLLRPIAFIGLISYPLYLIHFNVGFMLIKALNSSMWSRAALIAPILICAAWIIYAFVERPVIGLLSAIGERSRP